MGLDQFLMGIPLKYQTDDIASRDVDQKYWLVSVKEFDEEVKYNQKSHHQYFRHQKLPAKSTLGKKA